MARMVDASLRFRAPPRIADASIFLATIVGIAMLIVVLLTFDLFLASVDRRESAARAASEYGEGIALLRQGRAADAAYHFETAVSIDRGNVDYALALGDATLLEGRPGEAELFLRVLLERAENDGAVNLSMAHVMLREGRIQEAKAYLHRAIFGRWGADSVARRNQARFELIDLLAKRGSPRELLAELLPLEDVAPDSLALRRRLGHLFLLANSPARAANMFRELLRRDPEDVDAYAGMAEAALALGNFHTAHADLAAALRLQPDNALIAARQAVTDTLLALDPSSHDLTAIDRLSRSRLVLARAIALNHSCDGAPTASIDSAKMLLSRPATGHAARRDAESDADADRMMAATSELWANRPATCSDSRDEVLRLLVARISQ